MTARPAEKKEAEAGGDRRRPTEPVDRTDGIPDCARRRPLWKLLVLAAVFLAWLGVLVYVHLAG